MKAEARSSTQGGRQRKGTGRSNTTPPLKVEGIKTQCRRPKSLRCQLNRVRRIGWTVAETGAQDAFGSSSKTEIGFAERGRKNSQGHARPRGRAQQAAICEQRRRRPGQGVLIDHRTVRAPYKWSEVGKVADLHLHTVHGGVESVCYAKVVAVCKTTTDCHNLTPQCFYDAGCECAASVQPDVFLVTKETSAR